jgi:hypothetical protein
LYNLQKTFDGELDALVPREVILVVLFEEFAYGFRRPADGVGLRPQMETAIIGHRGWTHLPSAIYSTRFSLVEARPGVMGVEANDEGGYPEWSDTSGLCVFLAKNLRTPTAPEGGCIPV